MSDASPYFAEWCDHHWAVVDLINKIETELEK